MNHITLATLTVLFLATIASAQIQTYCSGDAGNIACTSYNPAESSQTYCSQIGGSLSCTTYDNNNTNQVRVQRNYENGQVIGTVLGDVVVRAIQGYRAKKQARKDWDQWIQDQMSRTELACETNPEMGGALGCRTFYFAVNSFIHKHHDDFFACQQNFDLFADVADKTLPADFTAEQTTEETIETLFTRIDKKRLKKR